MKYRIVEERDADGKVFNYQVQMRLFFMWLPGPFGYATLEGARQAVSRMTGASVVVPNATGEARPKWSEAE